MRRDWIAGIILEAVAIVYFIYADKIPRSQLSDGIGAAAFPKILAIILAILSAILILTGVFKKAPVSHEEAKVIAKKDKHAFFRAGGTVLIGIVYLIIISFVGYPIAVAVLITSMLLYTGEKLSWKVGITAVIGGGAFWVLFGIIFDIPVPLGLWASIF